MGGSAGGGGGVGSAVPQYIQNVHSDALAKVVDGICYRFVDTSMVEVFNKHIKNNPYAGRSPRSPTAEVNEIDFIINLYRTYAETFDVQDKTKELQSYTDEAMYDLENTILPKLKSQYRDEGATFTSTFYIANAKLQEQLFRDLNKVKSDLTLTQSKNKANLLSDFYKLYLEAVRMKAVLLDEASNQETSYREHEAKWEIESFAPFGNFLAAVSGGTVPIQSKQPSKLASAMGGALSGAATGAMIGAAGGPASPISVPMGAAIGGAVGLLGGIFK